MPYHSRIPEIMIALTENSRKARDRAGFMIEAGAKRRARVDTGYMRGQIRYIPATGEVIGGASYTIYQEYGTATISAQPMFIPAVEEVRPMFIGEMRIVVREAVG